MGVDSNPYKIPLMMTKFLTKFMHLLPLACRNPQMPQSLSQAFAPNQARKKEKRKKTGDTLKCIHNYQYISFQLSTSINHVHLTYGCRIIYSHILNKKYVKFIHLMFHILQFSLCTLKMTRIILFHIIRIQCLNSFHFIFHIFNNLSPWSSKITSKVYVGQSVMLELQYTQHAQSPPIRIRKDVLNLAHLKPTSN